MDRITEATRQGIQARMFIGLDRASRQELQKSLFFGASKSQHKYIRKETAPAGVKYIYQEQKQQKPAMKAYEIRNSKGMWLDIVHMRDTTPEEVKRVLIEHGEHGADIHVTEKDRPATKMDVIKQEIGGIRA